MTPDEWRALEKKGNKFHAKGQRINGDWFASKAEYARYKDLKLMEKARLLRDLERQVSYRLDVSGVHVCNYIADFRYTDVQTGLQVVEDAKGVRTPEYKLKAKLMLAIHQIKIKEIHA